jgi:phosphohistidine phosphatase
MIGATSKKLLLMRHAKSDWSHERMSDKDRPLNGRGHRSAPLVATWLSDNNLLPEVILCSSATRTQQTLSRMMETWAANQVATKTEIVYLDDLYLATAASILSIASRYSDFGSVLVLGHNPGMSDAVSYLSGEEHEMPTASVACFSTKGRLWPDDWLETGMWTLQQWIKPRDLE